MNVDIYNITLELVKAKLAHEMRLGDTRYTKDLRVAKEWLEGLVDEHVDYVRISASDERYARKLAYDDQLCIGMMTYREKGVFFFELLDQDIGTYEWDGVIRDLNLVASDMREDGRYFIR